MELSWPPYYGDREKETLLAETKEILKTLGQDVEAGVRTPDTCMWCKTEGTGLRLSMCGHGFCVDCVESIAVENAKSGHGGVMCKLCSRGQSVVLPMDVRPKLGAKRWEKLMHDVTTACIKAGRAQTAGLALCPNDKCKTITEAAVGYTMCVSCSVKGCSRCNVVNDPTHDGKSCADYQSELRLLARQGAFLRALQLGADTFVKENWPADLARIQDIVANPAMDVLCNTPSLHMFQAGLARLGCSTDDHNINRVGHFAWHGTADAAVSSICHDGFDPKRRCGQAYGRGEYDCALSTRLYVSLATSNC